MRIAARLIIFPCWDRIDGEWHIMQMRPIGVERKTSKSVLKGSKTSMPENIRQSIWALISCYCPYVHFTIWHYKRYDFI